MWLLAVVRMCAVGGRWQINGCRVAQSVRCKGWRVADWWGRQLVLGGACSGCGVWLSVGT